MNRGKCVRKLLINLLIILPIIFSTACSFLNNQIQESGELASENITSLSATYNNNILHTAMSPVESPTALITMKQQLRADPLWNALANEVIYCVQELSEKSKALKQHSIYIALLENPSTELKAFRSMIITKLVQNGFSITFNAKNAYHLKYDIINKDSDGQPIIRSNNNDNKREGLVVRVAVISGEKIMTYSRDLSDLSNFEKQKEILRLVRNK